MKNYFFQNLNRFIKKDTGDPAEVILKTFKNFGIKMDLMKAETGPIVTYFTFKLITPTRMKDLEGFNRDLNYALGVSNVRIDAPIPDTSFIGIVVPNKERMFIDLNEMWYTNEFSGNEEKLLIPLGKNFENKNIFVDLFKLPHLLISGQTSSGKTNFLHCLINSLSKKFNPEEVKFILTDPKRVEFSIYSGLPHLLAEPIFDTKKTINALKWLDFEMEKRYRLLQDLEVLDIKQYNRKSKEKMPYIIFIADEFVDFLIADRKNFEKHIVRILQMGRAVGLHIVLGTSRPERKVINNLICANITSRLCFKVSCAADAREIDLSGAEKLLGYGDALFQDMDHIKPIRLQTPFARNEEIIKNIESIKEDYLSRPGIIDDTDNLFGDNGENEDDEMYQLAKESILDAGRASTALLQRKLRIGYARAARLIDLLEENGVIGPQIGDKPRKILETSNEKEN